MARVIRSLLFVALVHAAGNAQVVREWVLSDSFY